MDRIVALAQHDDDEHSVLSRHSFSLYEDDCSVKEESKYDDSILSELIFKLRGGGTLPDQSQPESDTDAAGVTEGKTEEEDLTDDLITRHLKALTNRTKKTHYSSYDDDVSDTEDTTSSDDMSLMSHDSAFTLDEESLDEAAYAKVDEVMKKLGVNIDTVAEKENSRQWLHSVREKNAFDFADAPQSFSSKKQWLANLAADLMEEDDDQSVSTNLTEMDHIYEESRNGLANETKLAETLIANSSAGEPQQEPLAANTAATTESLSKPTTKRQWKPPSPPVKATSQTAELLARALAQKQPAAPLLPQSSVMANATEVVSETTNPESAESWTLVSVASSIAKITSQQKSLLTKPKPKTMADQLREKALAINKRKPIGNQQVEQESKSRNVQNIENYRENLEYLQSNLQSYEKPALEATREKSESAELLTELVKIATIERSQQPATKQPGAHKIATLPSGLPPYPGFGPKWPWHPDSPRAPQGYRKCYMEHMGEFYDQYMAYLQTRVANGGSEETKVEEIMRSSLSSQASFKKSLKRIPKKKPAISPSSFTARPGRARKNCAVPISLPRIEEGSNSSGSSGSEQHAAPIACKKITQKKTKPDVLTVGKIHPKSKGKVGKIIVVTGKELDKQAKEQKKNKAKKKTVALDHKQRAKTIANDSAISESAYETTNKEGQVELMTRKVESPNVLEASAHSLHSVSQRRTLSQEATKEVPAFPKQPSTTTTDQECGCIVM